jgi:hypothetical protein
MGTQHVCSPRNLPLEIHWAVLEPASGRSLKKRRRSPNLFWLALGAVLPPTSPPTRVHWCSACRTGNDGYHLNSGISEEKSPEEHQPPQGGAMLVREVSSQPEQTSRFLEESVP